MFTIATRSNAELIEANYRKWKDDPHSVNETWRAYFEGFELGLTEPRANRGKQTAQGEASASKQMNVSSLIYRYRSIGHTQANLDPLSSAPPSNPDLDLEQFELDEKDLEQSFDSGHFLENRSIKLKDLIKALEENLLRQHWI